MSRVEAFATRIKILAGRIIQQSSYLYCTAISWWKFFVKMVSRLSTYTAEFQLCSFHYLDSNYPPASNISPAFKILKILAVMVIGKIFICKVSITLGNLQVARSMEYCSIWLTWQDSNSGLLGSPNAEHCSMSLLLRAQAMLIWEEELQKKRKAGEIGRQAWEQKLTDKRATQVISLQVRGYYCMCQ